MPTYRNAARILPRDLVRALQKHAPGLCIYVPKPTGRVPWGSNTGARAMLDARNAAIRRRHAEGATASQLASEFHLSEGSIRKVLRGKNGSTRFRD